FAHHEINCTCRICYDALEFIQSAQHLFRKSRAFMRQCEIDGITPPADGSFGEHRPPCDTAAEIRRQLPRRRLVFEKFQPRLAESLRDISPNRIEVQHT